MSRTPAFQIICTPGAEVGRIAVLGELDLAVAQRLTDELRDAVKQAPLTVVDIGQVTFIDSTGVRALYDGYRAAQQLGHRLRVVNAHHWVARVLAVTGMLELLDPPGEHTLP